CCSMSPYFATSSAAISAATPGSRARVWTAFQASFFRNSISGESVGPIASPAANAAASDAALPSSPATTPAGVLTLDLPEAAHDLRRLAYDLLLLAGHF